MNDLIIEAGTFDHGILANGRYHRQFTLEEEVMRHSFEVSNDRTLSLKRLSGDEKADPPVLPDEGYFQACIFAARLKVDGVPKVTPEQVENLSKADGQQLMYLSALIEQRRELFRNEVAAAAAGCAGFPEDGLSGAGSVGDEPG